MVAVAPAVRKVAESSRIYRPRRARENPLFRILSDHYASFVEDYSDRYARTWGPFRRVVDRTVRGFLRCGLPEHGFARVRCPGCREEYLLPFSCRTRGVCTSCAAKRTAAWARWVVSDLARPVPHRHVVVTLPKILRPSFKFDRSLLTDLGRWVHECLCEIMAPLADEPVRPGCLAALELAGNLANVQPHVHLIVTAGAFSLDGARFYRLPGRFLEPLEKAVRFRVLERMRERGTVSEDRRRMLAGWRHSGFSVFAGRPIEPADTERLERLARYVRRSHLAESRVIYDETGGRVIYRSEKGVHPGFKANFRLFGAVDFVAEVCGLIPEAWRHETVAYGEYANVVRGRRKGPRADREIEILNPDARYVRKAWRHLIKHIYEVDPLLCACGREMRIVSIIDQPPVIERILRHLGLWPPPKRPPKPRPVRSVPCDRSQPRKPPRSRIPGFGKPHSNDGRVLPWTEGDFSQVPERWDEFDRDPEMPAE